MPKISPMFTIDLINKINTVLWNKFENNKYKNVELYIKRWHKDPEFDYYNNLIEDENFSIKYRENSSDIDLLSTLGAMDEELILQIAINLEIATPEMIPAVVEIKEILANDYKDAGMIFKKAFSKVSEDPSISVILANSALEAIIKRICKDERLKSCKNKSTLYDLVSHLLKEFKYFPDVKLNNNIKSIGSSLLNACQAIESIRSENTEGHGKTQEDYLINDSMYSMFILNAVTTVGLFLLNFYEKKYKNEIFEEELIKDCDIPF